MAKKGILVLILAVFLAMVYADGNAKDVPIKDIEKQLTEKTSIEKLAKCSNRNLMQFLNLDYEQYDGNIYYKGKEALSVDEILIIKVHRKEDLDAVKDAVETRIDNQITTFEGYGPAQIAALEDAIIFTKGNYLFYGVGKNTEEIEEVFEDAI